MACNRIPNSYPSLIVHLGEAFAGAESIGPDLPLLINTAPFIDADRWALITAQMEYREGRSALVPLWAARRAAVDAAYDFCLKSRDLLYNYLGRKWSAAWIAPGWLDTVEIPQGFDDLYALSSTLAAYFTAHPEQQNPALNITAAAAQSIFDTLESANTAVTRGEVLSATKRNARDAALTTARKRLIGLGKELSQRLEDSDPRWRSFGFNLPCAPTRPVVPANVVVTTQPVAKLQITCDASANAGRYRFYLQRPGIDAEPVLAGGSDEPLFVTEPLVSGAEYLIYVRAINDGAESQLSEPVNATPVLAVAA